MFRIDRRGLLVVGADAGSAKRAGGFCKSIYWFLPGQFLRKPALPDTKRLVSA